MKITFKAASELQSAKDKIKMEYDRIREGKTHVLFEKQELLMLLALLDEISLSVELEIK